jgi:hypothetical protein
MLVEGKSKPTAMAKVPLGFAARRRTYFWSLI